MFVLFGFILLVLAGAVVLLFAMLGELASRVPDRGASSRTRTVIPLETARLGRAPGQWPEGLAGCADGKPSVILVLSTACTACADVASQLSEGSPDASWEQLAVLVSCPDPDAGQEFIARHGLRRFPHHVDEGGEWVSEQFAVRQSPVALVFHDGRLRSAFQFADVAALRSTISDVAHQKEAV